MDASGRLGPEEFWHRVDAIDEQVRQGAGTRVVYGLSSWHGEVFLAEWNLGRGRRVLNYGGIPSAHGLSASVVTAEDQTAAEMGGFLLQHRSPQARAIPAPAGESRMALSAPATDRTADVLVGGKLVSFQRWDDDAAGLILAADIGLVTIGLALSEREFPRIAVDRVDDIEPYIEGRRAFLRRGRGEPDDPRP
jgi:hypothetical protein